MKPNSIHRLLFVLMAFVLILPQSVGAAPSSLAGQAAQQPAYQPPSPDLPVLGVQQKNGKDGEGEGKDLPLEREDWFYSLRTSGTNPDFTVKDAATLRAKAAELVLAEKSQAGINRPQQFAGDWTSIGPDPIVQIGRSPDYPALAMSGRIGALAIRSTSPYTMYLGAAQGGVWVSSTETNQWIPRTDQTPSLAIGAIALAPSNEDVVYVGTGEGALSGDSYFGNGVLKSTNAGQTFTQVSGDTFNQVSISKLAVDPNNPDHVYAAVLSGVAGSVAVRGSGATPYGIYESKDGGATWTGLLTTTNRLEGATDVVIDPQNPDILYASFWSRGIEKSTDGGQTWELAMNGMPPAADYTIAPTRFALGISHPTKTVSATLYTGFEWYDSSYNYHASGVWKSTDDAKHWSETSADVVGGYCGSSANFSQCWYDNVIAVDPSNPDIVYAMGLFNYDTGTGGIFRSMDGGATWINIGWHQHPDYHAFAFRADEPSHILVGNDGGVWYSPNYGGRLNATDPMTATDWVNLNGTVDPDTAAVTHRSGLAIAQFTGIAQNPSVGGRVYGGTQDNGTLRKSTISNTWYDMASGDGGHTLVDPSDPRYVYGTYYYVSPYRFTDGMLGYFFSNEAIYNGLDRTDRSAFYVPFILDPGDPARLYLGTYRVYRTDNRGDLWQDISSDLTSGCTSRANSRTGVACVVTALSANAGSPALYVGTGDGYLWMTPDSTVASPDWMRLDGDNSGLPIRPVSAIAMDASDYRVAYVAFSGFNAASLVHGHVFKTTDAGATWTDISGDLPDVPVDSLALDPSDPDTIYAGTDVGVLVTTNGGTSWVPLGNGFPIVSAVDLDVNPYLGLLRAGTHGRGAWSISNDTASPALVIKKQDTGVPVGPGSNLTYQITVENNGNATATGVTITDTIPAHTTFVSAGSSGTKVGNAVVWDVTTVPTPTVNGDYGGITPGSVTVTFTVKVDGDQTSGDKIVNQDLVVTSGEGAGATASPSSVTLSPGYFFTVSPASQQGGVRPGKAITYTETIQNQGFLSDMYDLSVSGNQWPTTLWDAGFNQQITQTASVTPGNSLDFGVKVMVPASAGNNDTDTAKVGVTSVGNPTLTQTATLTTTAINRDILVVDGDDNNPDVQSYYTDALDAAGYQYNVWDLSLNPNFPRDYLKAYKAVVWFTGASWPNAITPYEDQLAAFLDGGGRLFMSGMDILDQSGGTTQFVHDYLHINWDGTEAQNDTGTASVTAVPTNTVTGGMGTMDMDYASVGLLDYSDEITLVGPAVPAFLDDMDQPDALSVAAQDYKVVFLAFPFEAMGTAADRADLMKRSMKYFDITQNVTLYLPVIYNNWP